MHRLLQIVLLLDALVLVAAILLQAGKGGGLAASFGGASSSTDALFGTRQAGNLLTKASWWCGGMFIGLAFVLQISSSRGSAPKSVLDETFNPPKSARAPTQTVPSSGVPSVLQQPPAPAAKKTPEPPAKKP